MSLQRYWYSNNLVALLLAPLSWLYCAITDLRRWAYGAGLLPTSKVDVPVIVVGNISVGGTGKTPLVAWLVDVLRTAGWRPGIVSRGYGGKADHWPQAVNADSDPARVGDEPVLLAQRCGCPISVGPDRVAAAQALIRAGTCDVIVADDGLQHFALERDLEIAVVDGSRRFGNGRCLPAGPLRERVIRLEGVDFIISNGPGARHEYAMELEGEHAVAVDGSGRLEPLRAFGDRPVHAVAGIGYPPRFFSHLRRCGLQLIEHPFPDHHVFSARDLDFADQLPVLMTEKDGVKCKGLAASNHWQVPVTAVLDSHLAPRILERLAARRGSERRAAAGRRLEPDHSEPK